MNFTRALMVALALMGLCATTIPASAAGQAAQPQGDSVARLQRLAEEAGQRAAAGTTEPNEIEMIKYRRILTGKPGLQMYVVLLSRGGQPVDYFVTDGKCTSSGKRLTSMAF